MTHPSRLLLAALIFAGAQAPAFADAPAAPKTMQEATRSLDLQRGFIDVWRDVDKGRVLLSVAALDKPFLLMVSLPFGLGSNDVGLDRGQQSEAKLVHFEKRGGRLFLVQENTRFVADSANADERASATEAFASAVLWSGDILASDGGKHLVDFSSFLQTDRHGVAAKLTETKQGSYKVDEKRSAVLAEQAKSFPDNIELEAMLTFDGPGTAEFVRQVAADPNSLTLRQHVSMMRLPDGGFQRRAYDPYSGGFDTGYIDFGTPIGSSIDVRWQVRFRLEKTDPNAASSTVKKPIVFYVDRGAPEPVRSALIEGAGWWASAFEKAGFKDAYRVELLPAGVDPMDARYNVIHWVHRATRGWSYGMPTVDPRTGEIIKGTVSLGSQRVRQDILIAEALLAPFGKAGVGKEKLAEQMALARLRQLAAHEVGHTLGFSHNFAASRNGNGSVMDYPHPIVSLAAGGEPDLASAYGVGVGPWDDYIVNHAYTQFEAGKEAAGLAALPQAARAKKWEYVSDVDARSTGSSHPNGLLWDFGGNSVQTYDQLMTVRQRALQRFSIDVLPDARQAGELEARLVPVYLLHRYQVEGLARMIGGGDYEYATIGDVRSGASRGGVRAVPPEQQRQALDRIAASLTAETLALPANVLDAMTPPAMGFERNREYFATRMTNVFDAMSAVEAAAAQTCTFLFDAGRFNRIAWQNARDPRQPGVQEALDMILARTWKRAPVPSSLPAGEAVQLASNWVVLDALLKLTGSAGLHPSVAAQVRQQTADLGKWLAANPAKGATGQSRQQAADLIRRYLADPGKVELRALPAIPPGAPI
ncbi:MAG: zinc-dependent metalloprotease [Pseudomonadota bacterium]|nr:zinc-dependent metalloprotease [Pseudomonadota bacterium]